MRGLAAAPKEVPLREPDKAAPQRAVDDTVTILAVPPVGTTPNPPPFIFNKGWQGLSFAQATAAPPDVSIGVGPNHVVETINTAMAIYDKNGTLVTGPVSLDTFFNTAPFVTFDPKVVFDPESGRFFMVLIGNDATADVGRAWFATSQTSDPTGTWAIFELVTETGTFPDYPGLGFCSDKVIVTANQFTIATSVYQGAEFWVINKADLVGGSTTPSVVFFPPDNQVFTIQPAESQSPTTSQFMVATDNFVFTQIHFYEVSGVPGVSTVTNVRQAIPTGSFPPDARQLGGPVISTDGDRFLRATWRNGILWASATGACTPPGDFIPRACPRFTEIDTSGPTILQDFAYGVATFDFYWPALQTDANGNLVIVFTRSFPVEFAGLHFAGRLASDPPNTASATVLLKAGERSYDCTFCTGSERWGDYFHAVVDPVDGSLWVAGEYMGSPTSNDYATFIANLLTPVVPTTSTTSTTSTTTPPPRGAGWPGCTCEVEVALKPAGQ